MKCYKKPLNKPFEEVTMLAELAFIEGKWMMKKKTTIREYDKEGTLVKETITEEETEVAGTPTPWVGPYKPLGDTPNVLPCTPGTITPNTTPWPGTTITYEGPTTSPPYDIGTASGIDSPTGPEYTKTWNINDIGAALEHDMKLASDKALNTMS